MNNLIKKDEDLISYIKSIILKYCPYTEDRLSNLENEPQLDIKININDETQILFLFGNRIFKKSIPEQIITSNTIEFKEIENIIDFILEDHEVIENISLYNKELELNFTINWTEKSIKGINCGDIGLSLTFKDIELQKQYLYLLFQKYHTQLEHVPSFKAIKSQYINSVKKEYINKLNKKELLTLLNEMSEKELKELINSMNNDTFIKYTMGTNPNQKVKVLSLKETNKGD